MSKKPTGGPAFPGVDHLGEAYPGMTLRDYFAAKALQGLLADVPKFFHGSNWKQNTDECAYQMADLMLQERNK